MENITGFLSEYQRTLAEELAADSLLDRRESVLLHAQDLSEEHKGLLHMLYRETEASRLRLRKLRLMSKKQGRSRGDEKEEGIFYAIGKVFKLMEDTLRNTQRRTLASVILDIGVQSCKAEVDLSEVLDQLGIKWSSRNA